MIASVIPLGATTQQDGVELGVIWLVVGDDWMLVDFATRGIGGPAHLGIADDRGHAPAPMGGGASGDHTKVVRHHAAFREALHPQATECALTLVEGRENGRVLLET